METPATDSFRSVLGWFGVFGLLLLRKSNRAVQAWGLIVPLLAVYLALALVERQLNNYLVFHYHQYICSAFADLLRYLVLSVAVVLCVVDRLNLPWRWLRFLIVFLFLAMCGGIQISVNAWPMLGAGAWHIIFSLMLLLFLGMHSILNSVLRRWVRGDRLLRWYGGLSLVFGVLPLLILGIVEWHYSGSIRLQSARESYRITVVLTSAVTLPWFAHFWFVLLAARNSFWRQRFARAFGVTDLEMPTPSVSSVRG